MKRMCRKGLSERETKRRCQTEYAAKCGITNQMRARCYIRCATVGEIMSLLIYNSCIHILYK